MACILSFGEIMPLLKSEHNLNETPLLSSCLTEIRLICKNTDTLLSLWGNPALSIENSPMPNGCSKSQQFFTLQIIFYLFNFRPLDIPDLDDM